MITQVKFNKGTVKKEVFRIFIEWNVPFFISP